MPYHAATVAGPQADAMARSNRAAGRVGPTGTDARSQDIPGFDVVLHETLGPLRHHPVRPAEPAQAAEPAIDGQEPAAAEPREADRPPTGKPPVEPEPLAQDTQDEGRSDAPDASEVPDEGGAARPAEGDVPRTDTAAAVAMTLPAVAPVVPPAEAPVASGEGDAAAPATAGGQPADPTVPQAERPASTGLGVVRPEPQPAQAAQKATAEADPARPASGQSDPKAARTAAATARPAGTPAPKPEAVATPGATAELPQADSSAQGTALQAQAGRGKSEAKPPVVTPFDAVTVAMGREPDTKAKGSEPDVATPASRFEAMITSAAAEARPAAPTAQGAASAGPAAGAGGPAFVPADVDATANTERLSNVVQAAVGRNQSVARMMLEPPALGAVTVVLRMRQDKVDLRLEVASDAARDLVSRNMERLRESLQQQGISLDRTTVTVAARSESAGEREQPAWTDGGNPQPQQQHPQGGGHPTDDDASRPFAFEMHPRTAGDGEGRGGAVAVMQALSLNVWA